MSRISKHGEETPYNKWLPSLHIHKVKEVDVLACFQQDGNEINLKDYI